MLVTWIRSTPGQIPREGYREAARAVATSDPSAAFCAVGGARSVWRYYIRRPIFTPHSITELEDLITRHGELRILYFQASWQDPSQTEIAHFLMRSAESGRTGESIWWFIYRGPRR
jgi:hypothetical protein